MNYRTVFNEMRWGHFARKQWVRPRDVAAYFGSSLYRARDCLEAMRAQGEVEAAPDTGRWMKYRLAKGAR